MTIPLPSSRSCSRSVRRLRLPSGRLRQSHDVGRRVTHRRAIGSGWSAEGENIDREGHLSLHLAGQEPGRCRRLVPTILWPDHERFRSGGTRAPTGGIGEGPEQERERRYLNPSDVLARDGFRLEYRSPHLPDTCTPRIGWGSVNTWL